MTPRTGIKPTRLEKLGLILFGLLSVCVAAEVALRVAGYQPPEILTPAIGRTYRIQPNGEFVYRGYLEGMFSDFATPVKLNSLGFHDVEHRHERATPQTFRLMAIGDSFVAALSCPLETTFFRRLEAKLKKEDPLSRGDYEVIACGQGNQAQEKEAKYVATLAPVFKPDAVLLLFFVGNDFLENSPTTFKNAARFAAVHRRIVAPRKIAFFRNAFRLPRSRLNGLLAETLTSLYARHLYWFTDAVQRSDLIAPDLGAYRVPLDSDWQQAYAQTGELLARLKGECAAAGAPLLVAGLSGPQTLAADPSPPNASDGRPGFDPTQPTRWLADWCRANDVPFVLLDPALRAAGTGRVFWRHDGHLNPYGNAVIVDPIYDLIVSHMRTR